ncbi:NADH-quinone oxidoreductase subunit NuoE [Mesobaculum littorinae]|uniref:NADH-quinone oxidoreductase subunit NuoE n=1 Tax=Mesobaculum littorinae TaxID=2486419 RepID=A0A438AEX7_9RHOB|nr:NADH-quinone oxidoreductase subunit NuoE [Mesobaculum littorinae]RVV97256.1 NADH-quinone oxidoreductase subunit NuoE [Mesobaculum littorinae]
MLRRLYSDQPESFAFTPANLDWARAQITKYPEGRQASAVIPLLWRAQEQEGWLTRPAMEEVARMLDMAYIRVLEVATFYFMFQLQPVGSVAHVQVCGTTSCMICGAEDLIGLCREKIAPRPHELSEDGKFSWEEVECLGACSNAPMAQIGKDYYEDLTTESLAHILDEMAAGRVPRPGPQNSRFASEPKSGATSLLPEGEAANGANASVALAEEIGDTIKRIDGTEVPLRTPWQDKGDRPEGQPGPVRDDHLSPGVAAGPTDGPTPGPKPSEGRPADDTGVTEQEAPAHERGRPEARGDQPAGQPGPSDADHQAHAGSAAPAGDAPGREAGETGDDAAMPESGRHPQGDAAEDASAAGTTAADTAAPVSQEPASDTDTSEESRAAATLNESEAREPGRLDAPRGGQGDDLKQMRGVGPKVEEQLNALGIWHLDQVAGWSAAELAWVDRNLEGFRGRAVRDDWVGQARALTRGTA